MKRYIFMALMIFLIFSGCKYQEPRYYDSEANGVHFNGAGLLNINFANHILEVKDNYLPIKIPIQRLGYILDKPVRAVLKVAPREEGGDSIGIRIPEIIFEAGEYKKEVEIQIERPAEMGKTYEMQLYFDAQDPQSELGYGLVEKMFCKLDIVEKYSKPNTWDNTFAYYLGQWNAEKHVFVVRVLGDAQFYNESDWNKIPQINPKVIVAYRKAKDENPSFQASVEIPFLDDYQIDYPKPAYWQALHEKYLGTYSKQVFVTIARQLGVNTANEYELMTGDEKQIKDLNRAGVLGMMHKYNDYFTYSEPGISYKEKSWIPMFIDIDYESVVKPKCWTDEPSSEALLKKYYGSYSEEKYKFMLRTWLAKVSSEAFVINQLFPVITNQKDKDVVAEWDESLGGETQIKTCYKVFKEALEKLPNPTFNFPEVDE